MAESIIKLTLDTFRENRIQEPVVMQHDYNSRFIDATFTTLGVFEPISAAAEVMINAKRADGQGKSFSGEVNADGTVRVPIDQWMCALDDRVTCTISAVSAIPEQRLSTMPFTILVKASPNTTELPEEGTAEADVLAEVLAGEKDRVIEEAKRRANENARKSAEEARVRAEEQRLTDEATRVANEAERVSSELSRDATFKGWAQDIASLPSFDSRISANSDRLTNIEAGLPSSVWRVDDTAARVKDVPENARPKAIVSKIGGRTYKSKNLFIPSKVNTTSLGITFSYFNGYVKMSGTKTSGLNTITVQTPNITLPAGTYTVSCKMVSGSITLANNFDGVYFGINKDTYSLRTTPGVSVIGAVGKRVITLTEPTDIISFDITPGYKGEGTVFNDALFAFQLEAGDTATEYQDGYEGLRSAKVTEVKSVWANLFDYESHKKNGYTSIIKVIPNKALYRNAQIGYTDRWGVYDNAGVLIGTFESFKFTASTPMVLPSNAEYIKAIDSINSLEFFYLGYDSDTTYRPYTEHILPIPEAVQAIDGYGLGVNETVYNYIDWEKKQFVKRVGKVVFTGTESWTLWNSNMHTTKLDVVAKSDSEVLSNCTYPSRMSSGTNALYFKTEGAFDVDAWKGYLATQYANGNPVTLVYELATPEVTDISDLLSADNLISVEGGGTLTFENEYGYDIPNTVTYMLKEVTA